MARLVIGIIVGIAISLVSVSMFSLWTLRISKNILQTMVILFGSNFSYNILGSVGKIVKMDIIGFLFLPPVLLSWLLVGYVSGGIAKGVKRGIMAGLLVLVVDLLVWILLSVVTGADLMAMFQGNQLFVTLGGIGTGAIGGVLGGLLGGLTSGKYEEFY